MVAEIQTDKRDFEYSLLKHRINTSYKWKSFKTGLESRMSWGSFAPNY